MAHEHGRLAHSGIPMPCLVCFPSMGNAYTPKPASGCARRHDALVWILKVLVSRLRLRLTAAGVVLMEKAPPSQSVSLRDVDYKRALLTNIILYADSVNWMADEAGRFARSG